MREIGRPVDIGNGKCWESADEFVCFPFGAVAADDDYFVWGLVDGLDFVV